MQLIDLISPQHVAAQVQLSSKKKLLEYIARLIAQQVDIPSRSILDGFVAREKLGSTGLGQGIAIPHCRIADMPQPVAACVVLKEGVDFDAPDNTAVDLAFAVVVPEDVNDQHLKILAQIAELLHETTVPVHLRQARDAEELYSQLLDASNTAKST